MSRFAHFLASEYGISLIVAQTLDGKTVVGDFVDMPIDLVLQAIADRLAVGVKRVGSAYFIGELDRSDRGYLVRRVSRFSSDELQRLVTGVLTAEGSVISFEDGLLVAVDQEPGIAKLVSVLDELEANEAESWVVELIVVGIADSLRREKGIKNEVTLGVAVESLDTWRNPKVDLALDSLLMLSDESNQVEQLAETILVVQDGSPVKFSRLEKIPYVSDLRTTDSNVVSRSQRIDFLEVGFTADISIRSVRDGGILKAVVVSSRAGASGSGLPPTVSQDNFESVLPIGSGSAVLIGAFTGSVETQTRERGLSFVDGHQETQAEIQIWARCFKVNGPRREGPSGEGPDAASVGVEAAADSVLIRELPGDARDSAR